MTALHEPANTLRGHTTISVTHARRAANAGDVGVRIAHDFQVVQLELARHGREEPMLVRLGHPARESARTPE